MSRLAVGAVGVTVASRFGRSRWARAIWALGIAALLVAGSVCAAPAAARLESARFVPGAVLNSALIDAAPLVSLPHTVSVTHPGYRGDAWYVLQWRLESVPPVSQALYITATTLPMQVYVNGTLVGGTGPLDGRQPRSYEQSVGFAIPADVLVQGVNTIGLHVRMRNDGGGVGPVLAGNAASLHRRAVDDLLVHTFGPAAVGVATFSMGLFILVLWLRRRDPAYALFGCAAMLWSFHTIVSLVPEPPLPPPDWGIVWHGAYVLFVALLCLFCLRFTGVRWTAYRRLVVGYTIAVVPLLYLANAGGVLTSAALFVRLGALLLVSVALVAVGRYAWRCHNLESLLLLGAGVVSTGFALHDWLASQDPLAIRPVWLVPYAALAFLMLVGYILADRFVQALNESERMNLELEERVLQKSAALTRQLAATEAAKEAAEIAREAAETANLAKTRFLAAASHDLRQPLHALGMFSQALTQYAQDPEGRALVKRITASVEALEALFSALLDISKLDAGAVIVRPMHFAVRPLLERIAEDATTEALERGLKLGIVVGDAVVFSDPLLLERIVRNLVSNALRYTTEGGVLIGCRRRGGATYSIEVWDSGPGIPPEERERIFEEFYQIGNPGRDRALGLGLGLAIVRRLAALLDHRVEVSSRPGKGSVFRVIVAAGRADAVAASTAPGGTVDNVTAGRRVLVLEDEQDVRDATVHVLAQWGCDAVPAASLAQAQQTLRTRGPVDALIVDYGLRESSDGLAAIAVLQREFGPGMPAILVSGESTPDKLARIQESGIPLLHKPVSAARLRSVLTHLFASSEGQPRGTVEARPT